MKLHLKYKCIIPSAIFLLLTYYIYSQYFAASFKHTSKFSHLNLDHIDVVILSRVTNSYKA